MIRLSVNVNKVATVRNSRGGTVPSVLEAVRVCVAAGAPGITVHPRADARHITSADVREVVGVAADVERPRRVQHRRRSASGPAGAGARGEADPVHARAGATGRDHQPGRLVAGDAARGDLRVRATPASRWHPRQPVRGSRGRAHSLGGGRRRRPRRALHRAVRARVRTRATPRPRVVRRLRAGPRSWPRRSAWASTPATTSTSRIWFCSAACRIWTRCPSATRSSATRCSSASIAASATTWMRWR